MSLFTLDAAAARLGESGGVLSIWTFEGGNTWTIFVVSFLSDCFVSVSSLLRLLPLPSSFLSMVLAVAEVVFGVASAALGVSEHLLCTIFKIFRSFGCTSLFQCFAR